MLTSYSSKLVVLLLAVMLFASCRSKSNQRAIKEEDLDKVMQEEAANAPKTKSSLLTADDLMQLSECKDAACVQFFMKDKSDDFFYTKKGEYTSMNRGMITDTAANDYLMPFSTVYFASEPQSTWRIAHTLHKKELSDELMNEFVQKGFAVKDSFRYYATEAKCYRYTSPQHPGVLLYYSPTYRPWYLKGLYMKPKWLNYVFEIHFE